MRKKIKVALLGILFLIFPIHSMAIKFESLPVSIHERQEVRIPPTNLIDSLTEDMIRALEIERAKRRYAHQNNGIPRFSLAVLFNERGEALCQVSLFDHPEVAPSFAEVQSTPSSPLEGIRNCQNRELIIMADSARDAWVQEEVAYLLPWLGAAGVGCIVGLMASRSSFHDLSDGVVDTGIFLGSAVTGGPWGAFGSAMGNRIGSAISIGIGGTIDISVSGILGPSRPISVNDENITDVDITTIGSILGGVIGASIGGGKAGGFGGALAGAAGHLCYLAGEKFIFYQ